MSKTISLYGIIYLIIKIIGNPINCNPYPRDQNCANSLYKIDPTCSSWPPNNWPHSDPTFRLSPDSCLNWNEGTILSSFEITLQRISQIFPILLLWKDAFLYSGADSELKFSKWLFFGGFDLRLLNLSSIVDAFKGHFKKIYFHVFALKRLLVNIISTYLRIGTDTYSTILGIVWLSAGNCLIKRFFDGLSWPLFKALMMILWLLVEEVTLILYHSKRIARL